MSEADIAYYRSRLQQEELRLAHASRPEVAAAHRRMAEHYRRLLGAGGSGRGHAAPGGMSKAPAAHSFASASIR